MKDTVIYILAFLLALLFFYNGNHSDLTALFSNNNFKYIPNDEIVDAEEELILIYITSSSCPFCNDIKLLSVIDTIKFELNQKAKKFGYNFSAIGIGIESAPAIGLNHFNKTGYYDEIIIGNSWNNLGSIVYVLDHFKGIQMTPQIVVTKRKYQMRTPNVINIRNNIGINSETELVRKAGLSSILNWFDNGMELPNNLLE